ncbi:hypothetical protein [Exiguobacterium sp. B2(2022)]|uniref:hypothetical protein n=1 Tax=Exiguobacterium sp. B2(2022) TaxID=2992755 RepID=UPI00237B0648|nr:hypothetical protein [Exiguobacterium sp. B2(2022)]MDE0564778.1 hypothetical protein [Exiguobacterium sp. B2(2022)]
MNREDLLKQLHQVKELRELLDEKEELLRTMKSIALEAMNVEDSRRIVLNQSFQDLQNQVTYLGSKISVSFPEVLNNSIE